jgi:hypothetical protein
LASVLLFEPLEEGLFVNQNAATGAANDFIKAVSVSMKDQVTQTANGRSAVMFRPLR